MSYKYKAKEGYWYFTFGTGQLRHINLGFNASRLIIEVDGIDENEARDKVFSSIIGRDFCTSYPPVLIQDMLNTDHFTVMSLNQVIDKELKYTENWVIFVHEDYVLDGQDPLYGIFRRAINGGAHTLRCLDDAYHGTYYIWPDNTFCLSTEIEDYNWKSDDYYTIKIVGAN